jgi:pimeloyl-ACP methyl ester carboxylesterase
MERLVAGRERIYLDRFWNDFAAQPARFDAASRARLHMPVLGIGGDHSLGSTMAYIMRFAADNVREVVIADSGHWLMEEQPKATVAAIVDFLSKDSTSCH